MQRPVTTARADETARRLRQERMGEELAVYEPDADDEAWLYGDASGEADDRPGRAPSAWVSTTSSSS